MAYEDDALKMYQAGHIVVGGVDKVYPVREALKTLGCKWDAVHQKWCAPDARVLAIAQQIVQNGVNGATPMPAPTVNPPSFQPLIQQGGSPDPFAALTLGGVPVPVSPLQQFTAAIPKRRKSKQPEQDLREASTQALVAELVRRGVMQDQPETLCDALAERPPTAEELGEMLLACDQVFE